MLVGLAERPTDLSQEVDGAAGRDRTILFDECLQVHSAEQLHHVIEGPLVGHPEVVQLDRMDRSKRRGCLRFALESRVRAQHFRANDLHGGRPYQHPVLCPPHLAHPTGSETLDESVATDISSLAELDPEAVYDSRHEVRHPTTHVGREQEVTSEE